jgi:hypothetical protein
MKVFFSLIWRGWKKLAHGLGIVNTRILLTLTYFIILAVAALIGFALRADLLDRRMRKEATYWHKREHADVTLDTCRRQF